MSVVIDVIDSHSVGNRTSECLPKQTMNATRLAINTHDQIALVTIIYNEFSVPSLRIYSPISADEISVTSGNGVVALSVNDDMWMRITL